MALSHLSARERYRLAGRQLIRNRADSVLHQARVQSACEIEGAEPLQGALADMLHAGVADDQSESGVAKLLSDSSLYNRLAPHIAGELMKRSKSGMGLPRITPLATRWSVLVSPSLDVPARALLCGVDDSRSLATRVVVDVLAGSASAEDAFLLHCEGAGDSMAFMLARRALQRAGHEFSDRWEMVSVALQKEIIA